MGAHSQIRADGGGYGEQFLFGDGGRQNRGSRGRMQRDGCGAVSAVHTGVFLLQRLDAIGHFRHLRLELFQGGGEFRYGDSWHSFTWLLQRHQPVFLGRTQFAFGMQILEDLRHVVACAGGFDDRVDEPAAGGEYSRTCATWWRVLEGSMIASTSRRPAAT